MKPLEAENGLDIAGVAKHCLPNSTVLGMH